MSVEQVTLFVGRCPDCNWTRTFRSEVERDRWLRMHPHAEDYSHE